MRRAVNPKPHESGGSIPSPCTIRPFRLADSGFFYFMSRKAVYDKDQILADWKTGKYSTRKLAAKHRISYGTVHSIVSGVEKSLEPLINTEVAIRQELANLSDHELNTFVNEVNERTRHIVLFSTATEKNIITLMSKIDASMSIGEHLATQTTILRGKETVLGKEPSVAVQINNQGQTKPQSDLTPEQAWQSLIEV